MPHDLALTGQVPDLLLIDRSISPVRVVLIELTVPWDSVSSFKKAMDRKLDRYERLTEDLKKKGYNTLNMPLDIGCRGVVDSRNHGVLAAICSMVGLRGLKKLQATLARLALLRSYTQMFQRLVRSLNIETKNHQTYFTQYIQSRPAHGS